MENKTTVKTELVTEYERRYTEKRRAGLSKSDALSVLDSQAREDGHPAELMGKVHLRIAIKETKATLASAQAKHDEVAAKAE